MAQHRLHLDAGEAVRAVVTTTDPLRAQLAIYARPLDDASETIFSTAVANGPQPTGAPLKRGVSNQGALAAPSGRTVTQIAQEEYDPDSAAITAAPAGYEMLISSIMFRNGCDGGQSEWISFLAPFSADYYLAVVPVPDDDSTGAYTVKYQTTQVTGVSHKPDFDDSTHTLSETYRTAYESLSDFFTDASFFPSAQFVYGQAPYDNQGCQYDTGWVPTRAG